MQNHSQSLSGNYYFGGGGGGGVKHFAFDSKCFVGGDYRDDISFL